MTLSPGTKLGPYEIVGPLGAGGMGEVYRARDRKLERDVALKVLPQAVASDADRLARFEREAKTLAAVNHPNIAQVFGLEEGRADGGPSTSAIVMELVEGEELSAIIARGPIPVADAIAIARQIAEALEAAHEQGIVHRDLKPGNVKVRPDGTVKVLDFGLAKAVEAAAAAGGTKSPTITSPAMTHAGVVLGTAAYMAPEQAKGKVVDRRADIWSFGGVLYEMLTGMRAFPGEDVTDTIVSIMSREPDWLKLPAETPQSIRTLLKRMLDKDARRRLRDVGEARVMLEDLAAGRTPAVQEAEPPSRRNWIVLAAASAVIIVAGLAGFAAWSRRSPEVALPITRFSITLPPDYQFIRTLSHLIAISPDGSHLVHVGNRQLYLRSLSELESRPIRGTGVDPAEPFFSPDGQWIGFFSVADGRLRKVAISGGAPIEIVNLGKPSVGLFQGAVWSGEHILYSQTGKGIMRVTANGGEPEVLVPVERGFTYGPQPLPGSDAVLFSKTAATGDDRWDKADVVVYIPRTQETRVVLRGGSAAKYLSSGHLVYALGASILGVPFNLASLEVTGPPTTLIDNVRRVPGESAAVQFVISDSGTACYLSDSDVNPTAQVLMLIDRKGSATSLELAPDRYIAPRVSPDGKHLVVGTERQQEATIWVAELRPGAPLRRLTFEGRNVSPVWSADSRWILFMSDRTGTPTLFRQLADGSATAEPIGSWPGFARPDAVSPDGTAIVVVVGGNLSSVTAGGELKPLTTYVSNERNAAFSPDGRWFAYTLAQGALQNVFVEPFPPTGARYQITTAGGQMPLWSIDGRRLFYNPEAVPGAISRTLAAVDLRTTPALSFGPPSVVPIGPGVITVPRNFDLTPDGRWLMAIPATALTSGDDLKTTQEITVVLNWIEELKRKAPTR